MCLEITKQAVINEQSDEIFIRNRQKTINKVSTLQSEYISLNIFFNSSWYIFNFIVCMLAS